MRNHGLAVVLAVLGLACSSHVLAGEADWRLVWEDSFDRSEVGDGWTLVNGRATIQAGRLLLEGGGATIVTARGFAHDVRLEFEAEAQPGIPPCDLSAALAAAPVHGYRYLLAFGGQSNRVNQILGPGVAEVDADPPFVIEHAKRYRIRAQKEGRQLTLAVNGSVLVDCEVKDPLGGPGFDRVGLVTWAGMLVEDLKVYERRTPSPDSPQEIACISGPFVRAGRELRTWWAPFEPGLNEAIAAFNSGDMEKAYHLFDKVQNTLLSVWGKAFVLGDLAYQESDRRGEFRKLAQEFRDFASERPDDHSTAAAAQAAEWFAQLEMRRSGSVAAARLAAMGPCDLGDGLVQNPFYYKAKLYEARYLYWDGKEGGDSKRISQAVEMMAELKRLWPENPILRQYTGDNIPWGEDLIADTTRHPAWAAYLREAYARQIRLMERWFSERQADDGQLGGGWGDDVELLRTWTQIASISTGTSGVAAGIQRLADGIWTHELRDGYSAGVGDVEHSSEPSADALPTMLLLRYGDPLYVERNLASAKMIKEKFMGIDQKGYPRFKSTEFGADGVAMDPRAGGDTGYHARAMKHFIWLAWWGLPEARDWFVRWADGWRAATAAEIGDKLPGMPPPTIWYPSGGIQPPADARWWDPKWNYYGSPGLPGMVYDSILAAYYFSGDRKFLDVFQLAMEWATKGPLPKGAPSAPSEAWHHLVLTSVDDPGRTALYRFLTGERVYDEYTRRFGDAAQVYRTDYDLEACTSSFEHAAKALRHNLELQTTEVLSTDRAALANALTVFGAYTGAIQGLRDAATPTFAVTYETPNADFAALVTDSTPARLRVWFYSFDSEPVQIGLRPWLLSAGDYRLASGSLMEGEREGQHRYGWQDQEDVRILHRAEPVYVTVPPNQTWVIDLRLRSEESVPDEAADLAIAPRDVVLEGRRLTVKVHNIGARDITGFTLAVQAPAGSDWKTVAHRLVGRLPAPRGFNASSTQISFSLGKDLPLRSRVVADPRDEVYEICETNNAAVAH